MLPVEVRDMEEPAPVDVEEADIKLTGPAPDATREPRPLKVKEPTVAEELEVRLITEPLAPELTVAVARLIVPEPVVVKLSVPWELKVAEARDMFCAVLREIMPPGARNVIGGTVIGEAGNERLTILPELPWKAIPGAVPAMIEAEDVMVPPDDWMLPATEITPAPA